MTHVRGAPRNAIGQLSYRLMIVAYREKFVVRRDQPAHFGDLRPILLSYKLRILG